MFRLNAWFSEDFFQSFHAHIIPEGAMWYFLAETCKKPVLLDLQKLR